MERAMAVESGGRNFGHDTYKSSTEMDRRRPSGRQPK
jgi:hypothetical protein